MPVTPAGVPSRLVPFTDFGTNPGQLKAWSYVPQGMKRGAPLVVVLHGCTQTAAGYDRGSGWSTLADRHGFALLYPEQQRANNPNLCFNWFAPGDIARDRGEALSIRQMVAHAVATHAIDDSRIFVTGLSAGGAMTAVMLATYPEVFAGGGVIAGLPYGCATTVPEALSRMRTPDAAGGAELAERVIAASQHDGPWPSLSVWHGTADHTVAVSNMEALVEQWRALHALPAVPSSSDTIGGQARRRWADSRGRVRLEAIAIAGMAHGTPIAAGGPEGCGTPLPFMIEAGISSTRHLADFWGISGGAVGQSTAPASPAIAPPARARHDAVRLPKPLREAAPVLSGVAKVIDDALRAAGLLK